MGRAMTTEEQDIDKEVAKRKKDPPSPSQRPLPRDVT